MKAFYEFVQKFVELSGKYEYFDIYFETNAQNGVIYNTLFYIDLKNNKEEANIVLYIYDKYGEEELSIEFFYSPDGSKSYILSSVEYEPPEIVYENVCEKTNCKNNNANYNRKKHKINKEVLIKIIKIFTKLVFLSIEKIFKDKQKMYLLRGDVFRENSKEQCIEISINNHSDHTLPYKLHSIDLFNTYRFLSTKKYNDEIINAAHYVITALVKDIGEKLEKLEKRKHNS